MTALVTGAAGFLGGFVARALADSGADVRALVRRPGSAPAGTEEAPAGDLTDRAAVRTALSGVDTVVHLAARVHVMRDAARDPLAEFRRVNVEGTRTLLQEAASAGVRRFLFVSSVKAMGESTGDAPWTEEMPAHPVDPYGISKWEAEGVVRTLADSAGIHAPILRLPLVYGPGVRANMLRLMQMVDRGMPLPFGLVQNRRSLAYAENVAAAVVAALGASAASRETFLVSDGQDLSTPELVRAIARALGRKARLVPVPPALFRAAGRAGDVVSRIAPFPLTTPAVDRLLGSLAVDSSKLRRVTGFVPPFSVEEGLARTAAWYRGAEGA